MRRCGTGDRFLGADLPIELVLLGCKGGSVDASKLTDGMIEVVRSRRPEASGPFPTGHDAPVPRRSGAQATPALSGQASKRPTTAISHPWERAIKALSKSYLAGGQG